MLNGIWEEFLSIVKEEAGSRVVETWLKAVSLNQWDSINKVIVVQTPNTFIKDWIRTNYKELFTLHLKRLLNVDELTIHFVEGNKKEENAIVTNYNPSVSFVINSRSSKEQEFTSSSTAIVQNNIKKFGYLNTNYQFNTFIVGPNNSLSHAAAYAVTQRPGQVYNPLFIYGGSGLGKTHLLHAIGNEIKNNSKRAVVLYQTADRFVHEFINAIRFDRIHLFKEKYKEVDVLLIDDIQFLSNKEQTQEAFFHIFNSLYDAHKQIVFSGDTYPKDIQGIAERLRSRLECGLVTDIHAPTLETKIAILKKKAEMSNESLSDEVAYFIASIIDSNIRELEGSLIRVMAFANLTSQQITLDLARKVLGGTKTRSSRTITLADIARTVGKKYGLSLSELKSKSRSKEISLARQVTMFMMKNLTDKSLQDIGVFLNRKDHTTVSHAITKIQKLKECDVDFGILLKKLEEDVLN